MSFVFFFNDTATTEIYTLSLHDALPISRRPGGRGAHRADGGDLRLRPRPRLQGRPLAHGGRRLSGVRRRRERSEEHTSELQSLAYLVCRLLLEKKKAKPRHGSELQDTSA